MLNRLFLCALLLVTAAGLVGCDQAPTSESSPAKISLNIGRVPASDGASIAYTSRGAGDVALVFVHGWMCDQTYWRHQVPVFKDRFRVVTVDLPGHGDAAAERAEWSLEAYGADLAAVVEHLDLEKVVLVGHSMGGAVILEAAPLLGDRLAGLIGVETFHNAEFEVPEDQWQGLMEAYRQNFVGTCGGMVSAMFPSPTAELALAVKDDMCSGDPEVGIALLEQFGVYSAASKMAALKVPIRTINAEISTPTQVEVNQRHAPQFEALIQEGAGHFLMLEDPEPFNELFEETLAAMGFTP